MEIFHHWWEYFLVLSWTVYPPKFKKIGGDVPPSLDSFRDKYSKRIEHLSKDEKALGLFREKLSHLEDLENKTRNTIEGKAHSMISQSGLAAALLVATISLLAIKSNSWSYIPSIWVYFLLVITTLNLVAAALLARNVIVLEYKYPKQVISDLSKDYFFIDSLIEQMFIIKHSSYYNNIKASFLKYAHWYFKATFICILILVISLPFLYFSKPLEKDSKSNSKNIYIENSVNKYSTATILNEASIDSSQIQDQDVNKQNIDSLILNQKK